MRSFRLVQWILSSAMFEIGHKIFAHGPFLTKMWPVPRPRVTFVKTKIYFETGNCSVLKISKDWIFSAHKKKNIRGGILTRILLISHSLKMIATDKIHSTRGARSSSIGGIGQHIILNSCCHFFSQHIPFLMLLTRWITGGLKHTKTCFSLLAYFNSCINPVSWYKMQTWRWHKMIRF